MKKKLENRRSQPKKANGKGQEIRQLLNNLHRNLLKIDLILWRNNFIICLWILKKNFSTLDILI